MPHAANGRPRLLPGARVMNQLNNHTYGPLKTFEHVYLDLFLQARRCRKLKAKVVDVSTQDRMHTLQLLYVFCDVVASKLSFDRILEPQALVLQE